MCSVNPLVPGSLLFVINYTSMYLCYLSFFLFRNNAIHIRHYWAEAAEAFTMIQDEKGLLGISGAAADKSRAGQLMHVFCEHFATLATVPVKT